MAGGSPGATVDKPPKESEETKIIELVLPRKEVNKGMGVPAGYPLFVDQYGTPSTQIEGIVVAIDSEEFHNKVAYEYYAYNNKIFGAQSWDKAKRYLKILSTRDSKGNQKLPVFCPLRLHTAPDGTLYYDTGKLICRFDGDNYRVYTPEDCPIKFRRYKHSLEAPVLPHNPDQLTDLDVLNSVLGFFGSGNFHPALLPTFFVDQHSHPIVCFTGPAGSAKSTFQTFIKRLVDPTSGEKINIRDEKNDWVTLWDKFYILDFDNVRDILAEEADMLSRGVTGGSIIRRTLYTTSDVSIFSGKLRILMNGIRPEPSQFNDLLDRMIIVEMERISASKRLSDEKLWEKINEALPRIRYVCLHLAAKAYKNMWTYNHKNLPRLGEFARLGDAVNVELIGDDEDPRGKPGAFIEWYFRKVKEATSAGVEDNFASVMLRFLADGSTGWFTNDMHSTHEWMSQVYDYCTAWDGEFSRYHRFDLKRATEQKDFPKTAVAFGRRITEIIPILQDQGYDVRKLHSHLGNSYKIFSVP